MRVNPQLTLEGERRAEEHGVETVPLRDRALREPFLADTGKSGSNNGSGCRANDASSVKNSNIEKTVWALVVRVCRSENGVPC